MSPMQQVLADIDNNRFAEAVRGLRTRVSDLDKVSLDALPNPPDDHAIDFVRRMAEDYKQFEDTDHKVWRQQAGLDPLDDEI